MVLGSVDSYGHLVVSKLDTSGKGLCFSPSQWSMAAVALSFSKSIDVYDQDILLRTLRTSTTGNNAVAGADCTVTIYDPCRWSALSSWVHGSKYEITGLAFSSIDTNYIYVQGVDYEVFCGQWRENSKVFSFRGDSNWLGFSKCSNRDVLGGWSDSGSIFVADVVTKRD